MFADDVVILSESLIGLQRLFTVFASFCHANDLVISQNKTELLVCGKAATQFPEGEVTSFG